MNSQFSRQHLHCPKTLWLQKTEPVSDIRVEWYLKIIVDTHLMLYQTVIGPKYKNLTLKCCFLTWRWALENMLVTLKWAKNWSNYVFVVCAMGNVLFYVLKLTMKRNQKNVFTLTRSKIVCSYWELKIKILTNISQIFFLAIFLWSKTCSFVTWSLWFFCK